MNSYTLGITFVIVSTMLAVAGMLLVRKRVGVESLTSYHEVAGYLLSVIGTLYAVLLGFVVVDAMGKQQELRVIIEHEASGVANIFLSSYGLSDLESRKRLQDLCYEYAVEVINDEWPAMERGTYSPSAFSCAWKLWKEIGNRETGSEKEESVRQQILSEMCQMTENRRTRLITAGAGLSPVMWAVLFTYFFGVKSVLAQIIMTVLVAMTLALNVFLVFVFAYPLSGDLAVKPDAFKMDLLIFKHFDSGRIPVGEALPSR